MPKTAGLRDPAAAFPLPTARDDVQERRETNRAIAVSAAGLAVCHVGYQVTADLPAAYGGPWCCGTDITPPCRDPGGRNGIELISDYAF
jgi:hypothetical protein